MKYYLRVGKSILEKSRDLYRDEYPLGETSFNTLYLQSGYQILAQLGQQDPDNLDELTVIRSDGNEMNVEEFLLEVEEMKIKS